MSDETFIRHCSPTLAGLKTANLFLDQVSGKTELYEEIRKYNKRLVPHGIVIIPLKFTGKSALIYVFRPDRLKKDLSDKGAEEILAKCGYKERNINKAIRHLMKNLKSNETFPHEIGLFLSFPPCDVKGFIEEKAENYKYQGVWKVYGNVREAKETFRKYDECQKTFLRRFENGDRLENLVV